MSVHTIDPFDHDPGVRTAWARRLMTRSGELWRVLGPEGLGALARRRDQALDDAHERGEIAWAWREACMGSGLEQVVDLPTGPTTGVPRIGRVMLGPPTTITVRLRPGQLRGDVAAAAPRLAEVMGVPGIGVADLAPGWVVIELLTAPVGATGCRPRPASAAA